MRYLIGDGYNFAMSTETRRGPEPPDLSEKGGMKEGRPQRSDRRLFMQFLAFGGCPDATPLVDRLAHAKVSGVLYEDVNDPRGIALLTVSEDPDFFVDRVRPLLNGRDFRCSCRSPNTRCWGGLTRSATSRISAKFCWIVRAERF
jgi:hypothetical protein